MTTVALTPDLHRRLAMAAIEENAAAAEIIRQSIADYLDRRGKKRAKGEKP